MITHKDAEAIVKKYGIKMATKDDPIYNRLPTVLFCKPSINDWFYVRYS